MEVIRDKWYHLSKVWGFTDSFLLVFFKQHVHCNSWCPALMIGCQYPNRKNRITCSIMNVESQRWEVFTTSYILKFLCSKAIIIIIVILHLYSCILFTRALQLCCLCLSICPLTHQPCEVCQGYWPYCVE